MRQPDTDFSSVRERVLKVVNPFDLKVSPNMPWPGELDETYASSLSLISGPLAVLYDVITPNRKYYIRIALSSKQDRATATANFVKFWTCVFRYASRQTIKQTDRQTYRHSGHKTSHHYQKQSKIFCCHLIGPTLYWHERSMITYIGATFAINLQYYGML